MANLRTWSDEELCQFCIPKAWEDRLESVGCIATPVASAVVLFLWYLLGRKSVSFSDGAAIWVVGTLLLFWVLTEITGWRSRKQKGELARRYGQRAFDVYQTKARHEVREKSARQIYLFQGRDVEGEQYAFVKITLWATEPASGRLTVRIAPDFQRADFKTLSVGELVNQERELTQEEATALETVRPWSTGSRRRRAPKSDENGYACSVAALDALSESMTTYNLLNTTILRANPLALQLTLRLLHLAETVTDHPLVSHWEMPGKDTRPFRLELSEVWAKRLFQSPNPPDWVILFNWAALPHGGSHSMHVVLSEADPHGGRLWTASRAYKRSNRRDPRSHEKAHGKELSVAQWQVLMDHLHAITPQADLKLPRFPVHDGLPCNLVVLHRSPSERTWAECNLAGLTASQAQEPLVHLMHTLLGLRREAGAEAALYGTCDYLTGI